VRVLACILPRSLQHCDDSVREKGRRAPNSHAPIRPCYLTIGHTLLLREVSFQDLVRDIQSLAGGPASKRCLRWRSHDWRVSSVLGGTAGNEERPRRPLSNNDVGGPDTDGGASSVGTLVAGNPVPPQLMATGRGIGSLHRGSCPAVAVSCGSGDRPATSSTTRPRFSRRWRLIAAQRCDDHTGCARPR
jgi:hypothetical protein